MNRRLMIQVDEVEVAYLLPFLAGCGLAGAMVLIGGTYVRLAAFHQWSRNIDENQYVRLMAAAMWALIPFCILAVVLGAAASLLLDTPVAFLVMLPVMLAAGFAMLARSAVQQLSCLDQDEKTCDRCGYLLRRLVTARCPECGEPFPAEWIEAPA